MALVAYKGDKTLKTKFLKEIKKHREADAITQGTYGKQNGTWKGCAVACSLRSLDIIEGNPLQESYNQHKRYEEGLGIPEWLARLGDTIFEGLPIEDSTKWPEQFAKAIPVGANLESVKWQFCAYLMKENIDRVLGLDISDELKEQVVSAIRQVLVVHEAAIKTGEWDESAARSAAQSAARSAAESAAESAARSAAQSAARSAAESAAESAARSAAQSAARSAAESAARSAAESAAESAARSAAQSAARSAARSAAFVKHSKELLKLLRAA